METKNISYKLRAATNSYAATGHNTVSEYFACFKVFSDVVEMNEPVLPLVHGYVVSCSEVSMVITANRAHQETRSLTSCPTYDPSLGDFWSVDRPRSRVSNMAGLSFSFGL